MLENTAVKPHHVVIYARVARHETDALHRQVAWLRQVADAHGWTAVHVITEARGQGINDEALAALRAADVVIVAHQDRLARTPTRLLDIRTALLASGVEIVSGGSRHSEQQAEQELAVLRGLVRAAEATSASAVRVRTAPAAGQDARARRVPAGYRVVEEGILLDDRIVEQLVAVMRDLDRANHGHRTRAGMAAAEVRQEARR